MKKPGIQSSIFCLGLYFFLTGYSNGKEPLYYKAGESTAEKVLADKADKHERTPDGEEVRLYDEEGREICLFFIPGKFQISAGPNDIWDVGIKWKDSFVYHIYVDGKNGKISDIYADSIPVGNKYVAYMEDHEKLVLEDMFGYGRYYGEYLEIRRDFGDNIPAVISITPVEDDTILLEYYKGEQNEIVTEEICISDYKWDLSRWRKNTVDGSDEEYCRYTCKEVTDGFELKLYGRENEEIYSFVYPKEPNIGKISDNVMEISISTGTESVYLLYFDRKNGKISDVYYNAIPIEDKYVAYMDDHEKLKIESMFGQEFYAEIERDYSRAAAPGYQIARIKLIDEETIFLRYLKGRDYEWVMEIICLTDYGKEGRHE